MYATLLLQCLAVQQVHLDHAWLVDSQIGIPKSVQPSASFETALTLPLKISFCPAVT